MSSRPKRKCKGTNLPHLRVWKTPSPSKVMDPVTNDSLSVTQEEDSSMSPQPLIVDKSQEWKIRAEVLAEEDSSLKDKVKLLEEALLAQKVASDEKITSLESERERLANILSVVEAQRQARSSEQTVRLVSPARPPDPVVQIAGQNLGAEPATIQE
ncbi:Uncharacterized protein APZ42_026221 [Daphnia magna]|uniref:Uncharacterized protein n=1 Tax=Daphnia magna TaxID=35525 RepID=A0A164SE24_9CRUS|nr:Uncharacterized protein APZ42_026221 [Daphnia magna]